MATIIQVGIVRVGSDPLLKDVPIPADWVYGPVTVLVTGSAATVPGLTSPAAEKDLQQLAWHARTVGDGTEAVQVAFNGAAASDSNGWLMAGTDLLQCRVTQTGATVSVKTRAIS